MMLLIGNKHKTKKGLIFRRGFTLVEIMVATAILSLGLVLIFEAFFTSLDAFNYYNNYLYVFNLAEEKIWEAQDHIERFGSLSNIETSGEIEAKKRIFNWYLISAPLDQTDNLHKIDLQFSWKQGKRQPKINRCIYAKFQDAEIK